MAEPPTRYSGSLLRSVPLLAANTPTLALSLFLSPTGAKVCLFHSARLRGVAEASEVLIILHPHNVSVGVPDGNY